MSLWDNVSSSTLLDTKYEPGTFDTTSTSIVNPFTESDTTNMTFNPFTTTSNPFTESDTTSNPFTATSTESDTTEASSTTSLPVLDIILLIAGIILSIVLVVKVKNTVLRILFPIITVLSCLIALKVPQFRLISTFMIFLTTVCLLLNDLIDL